jgi:hypothetical protein
VLLYAKHQYSRREAQVAGYLPTMNHLAANHLQTLQTTLDLRSAVVVCHAASASWLHCPRSIGRGFSFYSWRFVGEFFYFYRYFYACLPFNATAEVGA